MLVRLCQSIDYGQILNLAVFEREPIYNPPPSLLLDIKLNADCGGRSECELMDFALCEEVCSLLDRLDRMKGGCIRRIEVRAGIPRRILVEASFSEATR